MPPAGPVPTVHLDAAQLSELSAVFSAPRWLRDLGFASWLLLGVAALGFSLILLLDATSVIVSPVVAGFVVATVVSPVVAVIQRRGVPRAAGAIVALLGVAALGVLIVVLVVGGIVSQTDQISSESAAAATKLQGWLQDAGVSSKGASDATSSVKTDLPNIISTLVSGITWSIAGADLARLRGLVHPVLAVLPAEGRAGDAPLGRTPDGRAASRRTHHHRRRDPVAAPLLRRCDHRRRVQRHRRRHRGAGARCAAGRHDRGGHVRDRLHPVHRRLRLRRLRGDPGAGVAGDEHRARSCS